MKELSGMKFPETAEEMMLLVRDEMTETQKTAMLMEMIWHNYHPILEDKERIEGQLASKAYHSAVFVPVSFMIKRD